jgi:predicted nucleotidyltransferase component of viral defense system
MEDSDKYKTGDISMIPRDYITEWRREAPWIEDYLVEQDLVLTWAITEIFSDTALQRQLAFRGGTAIHKLFLTPAVRFSEDIDLVLVDAQRIGPIFDKIRSRLDPILGTPKRDRSNHTATLKYRFESEDLPPVPLRLKVEINIWEHMNLYGFVQKELSIDSRWYQGNAIINTYGIDELLSTKLRALYQRRKGRDLFDLAYALRYANIDEERIVNAFLAYIKNQGLHVSQSEFSDNLIEKLQNPLFVADLTPLLRIGASWNPEADGALIMEHLVSRLP